MCEELIEDLVLASEGDDTEKEEEEMGNQDGGDPNLVLL